MFQRVTILGITKLTGFNKKYGIFDGIGHSSIGNNKTGSRRIDKTYPKKKYVEGSRVIRRDWRLQHWEQQDRFKEDRQDASDEELYQLFRTIPGTINLWTSPNNKAEVNHYTVSQLH